MPGSWDNISDAIFHFAEVRPHSPAVIDGARTLSWRQFAALVGAAAVYLRRLGIESDDRIGVALPDCADHLILSFALMRLGAVPVEIAYRTPASAAAAIGRRFGLRAVAVEASMEPVAAPLQLVIEAHWQRELAAQGGDARSDRGADDNRLIMLSSGSSGHPKAVATTHRQRILRARARMELVGERWSPERPGIFLLTHMIAHAGFHEWMMYQVFIGGPLAVLPIYSFETDLIRAIGSFENATCVVTPNMCRSFLAYHRAAESLFPDVQAMITTGLPLFAKERRALIERITPNFYDVYGSSGFGMITGLRPEDMTAKPATVGRPSSAATLEIVDSAGRPLPAGAVGRLRCRGDTMASGFVEVPGAIFEPESFRDGWYYPGDIALLDGQGYLHLKGRATDLIVRRGVEIYPPEIEQVMLALPGVREAAVVGRPDSQGGEEVVACVVRIPELAHEDLVAHCRRRLPPGKLPQQIYYLTALPKTANGKIDRPAIKAVAQRRTAADIRVT